MLGIAKRVARPRALEPSYVFVFGELRGTHIGMFRFLTEVRRKTRIEQAKFRSEHIARISQVQARFNGIAMLTVTPDSFHKNVTSLPGFS